MKIFSTILLLFIIVLNSCKSPLDIEQNVIKNQDDTTVIRPLQTGNLWIYNTTYYSPEGNIQSITSDTLSIVSEFIFNNEKWFLEASTAAPGDSIYLKNRSDGLWQRDTAGKEQLLCKYPGKIGDKYYIDSNFGKTADTNKTSRSIVSLNEQLSMSSGTYTCYKYWDVLYNQSGETLFDPYNINYYQPNIGLIKTIHYEISKTGQVYLFKKTELARFNSAR